MGILRKKLAQMRIRKYGLSPLELRILTQIGKAPVHHSDLMPLAEESAPELISITANQHLSRVLKGLVQKNFTLVSGEGYILSSRGRKILRRIPEKYRDAEDVQTSFASAATIVLYLSSGLLSLLAFLITGSGELLAVSVVLLNFILAFVVTWKGLETPREKLTAKAIALMSLVSALGLIFLGIESLFSPFIVRRLMYITMTVCVLGISGLAFARLSRIQKALGHRYASFSSVALAHSARRHAWLCVGAIAFCFCSFVSLHFVVSFFLVACGISLFIRAARIIESTRKCVSPRLALVRWFEQLSRNSREPFFLNWVEKLLGERACTKEEILTIYRAHFIKQNTPFFDKIMISLSRDAWLETNIDTLLGHLLFEKRIRIADDRFIKM
jgi:hypothetical protein